MRNVCRALPCRQLQRVVPGLALLMRLAVGPAEAQGVEEFYRGKTVNVIVGFSVGGGYDIYARVLARHIGRYLPGNPNFVVQNMPGAGSSKSVEYLLSVAPKDGLAIGTFGRALMLAPLLEGARVDTTKLQWIGSMTSDTTTCIVWHASPIKTWADLRAKQFTAGGLGKGSDPELFATIVKNLFAPGLKLVSGYPGTNDITLAMERGEVDGICGYSWSTLKTSRPQWLAENKVAVLVQGALVKNPELPNVPMMLDDAANETQRQVLTLLLTTLPMARPFGMPPGTPAERVAAMRTAFDATMKDAEFLKEARTGGLDIDPMQGTQMAGHLQRAYAMPPEIVAQAAKAAGY